MVASPSTPRRTGRVFVVAALDRRLRISVAGSGADAAAEEFSRAWGQLLVDDDVDVDRELTIDVEAADAGEPADAQVRASMLITLALIELNVGRGLLFHAAAATDSDGRALLLVGPSGAGKTTAVAHLARATSYLTDETALVDEEGAVAGYPKPLSLVDHGAQTLRAASDLGLAVASPARARVERVLIVDRSCGTPGRMPVTSRLSIAEGIVAVVPQLSGLSAHPSPLVALARLSRRVGGFERLQYSDVHDIDPEAGPPTTPRLAEPELVFSVPQRRRERCADTDTDTESDTDGLVQTPTDDAIEASGALLIARKGRVTVLAGIARTIWLETTRPTGFDVLLDGLRTVHGRARDDEEQFRRVVAGLIDGGILEWRR